MSEFLGGAPGDKGFADPKTLAVSIITCVLVVVLSQFGKGMVKALSYLIALVVGTALSLAFGMADFSACGLQAVARPASSSCRMAVSISTRRCFVPFFIAYLVAIMEALGVYQAAT